MDYNIYHAAMHAPPGVFAELLVLVEGTRTAITYMYYAFHIILRFYLFLTSISIYVSPKMRTVPVRELGSQFAN